MGHILRLLVMSLFISAALCTSGEALVTQTTFSSTVCAIYDGSGKELPHKVLLFLDSNFFSLFRNWVVYYKRICHGPQYDSQLELVCLDDQLEPMLSDLGLHCSRNETGVTIRVPSSNNDSNETVHLDRDRHSQVWLKRLEIMHSMLNAGTNLILSDTDAFWLNNPYPEVSRHAATSVIVSSRGWFPFSISRIWGSTVCMGFMYIKSDPFTIALFRKVLDKMLQKQQEVQAYHNFITRNETVYTDSITSKTVVFDIKRWDMSDNKHPDDQYAFNALLLEMNIKWPATMTSPVECRKFPHIGSISSEGMTHNITLLPEESFVRNCAENPIYSIDILKLPTKRIRSMLRKRISNATVVHCLISPGNSKKKEVYLIYYSLWKLPYDITAAQDFLFRDKTKKKSTITPVLD